VEALYAYRDTERMGSEVPFMMVHGILSRLLYNFEPELLSHDGLELNSRDIFGDQAGAARWRKVE